MGRRLATEVRGRRRAAAIRKNVWRHARVRLLLPCPYSTSLDLRLGLFPGRRSRLGAWAWAQRGGGSPRRGGSGDGAGAGAGGPRAGVMAGHQGWAVPRRKGEGSGSTNWPF